MQAARDGASVRRRVRYTHGENLHLLEIPPGLDSLSDVRAFVDAIFLSAILSPQRVFDLKVALSEAAANAIEHGKATVNVAVWVLLNRVVVDVTNVGEFGSPTDRPPSGRTRGFGLKLMVSLADEVTFIRGRRGRTMVRLTFMKDCLEVPSLPPDDQGHDR
jgi:anti-sigma regulatory factor (Ser/Thr protein kinase)